MPKSWKSASGTQTVSAPPLVIYEELIKRNNVSSWAYKRLTYRPERLDAKRIKWNSELKIHLSLEEYVQCIAHIDVLTIVPKLRSFQYRMVQRSLVTNVHLCQWGLRSNDLCSFCHSQREDINHLFVFCDKVKEIWLQVEEHMSERFGSREINFDIESVLFS